jgi:predicted DCC family thiol-disulfide oxidoreductase YuxK
MLVSNGMDQPKRILYYDSHCGVCSAFVDGTRSHNTDVEYVSIHNLPPGAGPDSFTALEKEIHLTSPDGTVLKGPAAILTLWSANARWKRVIANILLLPGVVLITRLVYRIVARYRHRISTLLSRGS